MATVAQAGYSGKRSDNNPKYDGIKRNNGQFVKAGEIIVKQRNTKYKSNIGTYSSRTGNIHAAVDGYVYFEKNTKNNFANKNYVFTYVGVKPLDKK